MAKMKFVSKPTSEQGYTMSLKENKYFRKQKIYKRTLYCSVIVNVLLILNLIFNNL